MQGQRRPVDCRGVTQTYHVGAFSDNPDTCCDESLGFLLGDFVLGGRGQGNISLLHEQPRALAWIETN